MCSYMDELCILTYLQACMVVDHGPNNDFRSGATENSVLVTFF